MYVECQFHESTEVLIGYAAGTAFAEVTKKGKLEYLGRLPAQNDSVIWREIKMVRDTMIVGSEGVGHGVQFFDLNKLLDLSPAAPKTFSIDTDIAWLNLTQGIPGRSHTVQANEELNYAMAVGCGGRPGRNRLHVDMLGAGTGHSGGGTVADPRRGSFGGRCRVARDQGIAIGGYSCRGATIRRRAAP